MIGWGTPPEKFTDVTKLGRVVSMLEGRVAVQKWTSRNHVKF